MSRNKTPRQQLKEQLPLGEFTVENLAGILDLPVKRVLDDLKHVRRSNPDSFDIRPARCRGCGFEFSDRDRLDRPSRCPECREQRVNGPWFSLDGEDE
jgi:predicted Zn-ribbon and HTH transcriptional regulator